MKVSVKTIAVLAGLILPASFVMAAGDDPRPPDKRKRVYSGEEEPPRRLGNAGDLYFDSSTPGQLKVYKKSSQDSWLPMGALQEGGAAPGTGTAQTCPPGAAMIGIDAEGKIRCDPKHANVCSNHGAFINGMCSCDQGWTGAVCEKKARAKSPDAAPDDDHDNVPAPADCDDHNDLVYPEAPEVPDGQDNNCDGQIDEAQ